MKYLVHQCIPYDPPMRGYKISHYETDDIGGVVVGGSDILTVIINIPNDDNIQITFHSEPSNNFSVLFYSTGHADIMIEEEEPFSDENIQRVVVNFEKVFPHGIDLSKISGVVYMPNGITEWNIRDNTLCFRNPADLLKWKMSQ